MVPSLAGVELVDSFGLLLTWLTVVFVLDCVTAMSESVVLYEVYVAVELQRSD